MWLFNCLLMVCVLVPTLCDNDTLTCEPGEEEDCSKCYKYFASQVIYSDRNMFEIQNVFFPPDEESPVFVTVTYKYENTSDVDNNETEYEIWFWSTSTFYIFQPLNVFQFTSIFFSDTQMVTSNVTLTLPLDCYNASEEHKTLLTQRLKLYATRQSITSPIDDEYNPKAMNVATLKKWHKRSNHAQYSRFIVANFLIFPIFSWAFLLFLFGYINHFSPSSRIDRITDFFKKKEKKRIFAYTLRLQDEFILSFVFVIFAFSLSSTAVYNAENIANELNNETGMYFNISSDVEGLRNMYSLVIVTVILDTIVFTFFILWPITLLIGCFIGYPIFTYLQFYEYSPETPPSLPGGTQESKVPWQHWWTFCMYSTLFPLCCLANHLNYIIIAFIHNLYRATSVAIVYGVIIIFLSVMLNRLPYVLFRKKIDKKEIEDGIKWLLSGILAVKVIAVVVLLGYVSIDILVYFFIPIEEAFEDAANHFISIYSTTAVFFTGLAAYFFVQSFTSPIHIFTKAMDVLFHQENEKNIINITREDWKKLGADDKDVEVAKGLLKKIS